MKIWVNTLVKNEERFLWYSATSIIDWVDKILIWDTGSTDKTIEIIKELKKAYPQKIDFKEVGEVSVDEFTEVRQKMLEETKSDWFIILDGDEVWWEDAIKQVVELINKKGDQLESIVNRYINLVGDIYHFQEEAAGRYEIDGRRGHLTIRAMKRSIPGLHLAKPHGQQGFFDGEGRLIQARSAKRREFIETPAFLHFTHLVRSSSRKKDLIVPKRKIKLKYELGTPFPLDFYYPEAFFKPRPKIVSCPWQKMDKAFFIKAAFLTLPKKVKRRLIKGRSGY